MTTNPSSSSQLINERQLSELLNVKVATVRRWRQHHRGPRFIKVEGAVRYNLSDVMAWLDARPAGGEVLL